MAAYVLTVGLPIAFVLILLCASLAFGEDESAESAPSEWGAEAMARHFADALAEREGR